jgi:hypothetical protein
MQDFKEREMQYMMSQDGSCIIQTNDDGSTMFIPEDAGNRHYQEYLEWKAAGGTTLPYTPPPMTWTDYQNLAKAKLADTDIVVTRIAEAVALGNTTFQAADVVAYMSYRRALRGIVSATITGDPNAPLPKQPAYPAGT